MVLIVAITRNVGKTDHSEQKHYPVKYVSLNSNERNPGSLGQRLPISASTLPYMPNEWNTIVYAAVKRLTKYKPIPKSFEAYH